MSIRPVFVDLSMNIAKDEFELERVDDYGERVGSCQECGHPIRYGFVFYNPNTDEEFILGGTCQYKVFLFRQWHNLKVEDIDSDLLEIGKVLWNISKNDLYDDVVAWIYDHNLQINLKKIPRKGERKEYRKILMIAYKNTLRIKKKEEKRRKEAENVSEETKEFVRISEEIIANDRDYQQLKSFEFQNPDDEKTRQSLLSYYKRSIRVYGRKEGWSQKQRRLARYLIIKNKERGTLPQQDERKREELLTFIVQSYPNFEQDYIRNFLKSMYKMIKGKRRLSEKQRNFLIKLIGKRVDSQMVDYIRTL